MKKIKLLNIIPIATLVATITPLVTTSCSSKKEEEKSKVKFEQMNMNSTTSLNDFNEAKEPMFVVNTDPYHAAGIYVWIPDAFTEDVIEVQYQKGTFNGEDEINWGDTWTTLKCGEFRNEISATQPWRFRAITEDGGILNNSTNQINIQITSNSWDQKGVIIGGSAKSLIGKLEDDKLLVPTDLLDATSSEYIFYKLFSGSSGIQTINSNFLPFATMRSHCYDSMFKQCHLLKDAPALPSSKLAESCYENMFSECNYMQVAPHLPAIALVKNCYKQMFQQCTLLKSISLGYIGNFLNSAATDATNTYFYNWVEGVGKSEQEPTLGGTIHYNGCDTEISDGAIPSGFKVVKDQNLINTKTKTVTVVDDQSWTEGGKTCTFEANAKKSVRVWLKTDTTETTFVKDIKSQISTPTSTFSTFRDLKCCDHLTHTVIDEGSPITDDMTIDYSYFQTPFVVDPTVTNIVSGYTAEEEAADKTGTKITKITIDPASGSSLQYKTSTKDWTSITSETTIELHAEDGIQLKGDIGTTGYSNYTNINITGKCSLQGTVWSLLGDKTTLPDYAFYCLFDGSTGITSIDKNYLLKYGAKEGDTYALSPWCYSYMFYECTNLVGSYDEQGNVIPMVIPMPKDISSAGACCEQMFAGCTSLLKAPELTAETLPEPVSLSSDKYGVYEGMFYECTSLTDGPSILPATTVPNVAYNHMFYGCSQLVNAPKIMAETVKPGATVSGSNFKSAMLNMFYNCKSLVNAPEMKNVEDVGKYGMYRMFYGCTSLKDASNITLGQMDAGGSGTLQLTEDCFQEMFYGCTSLSNAPDMNGIAYNQTNNGGFGPSGPSSGYCFKMFYNTNLTLTTTETTGYKKFFTCFNYDKSDDVYQMFNKSWNPKYGVTYYYYVSEE